LGRDNLVERNGLAAADVEGRGAAASRFLSLERKKRGKEKGVADLDSWFRESRRDARVCWRRGERMKRRKEGGHLCLGGKKGGKGKRVCSAKFASLLALSARPLREGGRRKKKSPVHLPRREEKGKSTANWSLNKALNTVGQEKEEKGVIVALDGTKERGGKKKT